MYEVVLDLVDDQINELPAEARARLVEVVAEVAQHPHEGYVAGSTDDDVEYLTRHWPFDLGTGYGLILYTIFYDPNRVLVEDILWIG